MIIQVGYVRNVETGDQQPIYFPITLGENEKFIQYVKLFNTDAYGIDATTGKIILVPPERLPINESGEYVVGDIIQPIDEGDSLEAEVMVE